MGRPVAFVSFKKAILDAFEPVDDPTERTYVDYAAALSSVSPQRSNYPPKATLARCGQGEPVAISCQNWHNRRVGPGLKPLIWVATSLEDLKAFPDEVRRIMGYALYLAQAGQKHLDANPLKGFGGAGVLEIVEDFEGNAYRAVYTVRLAGAVYVLHAFQKKSRRGVRTSRADIVRLSARLRLAEEIHARRGHSKEEGE